MLKTFVRILRANHFTVDSVCCKNGSVPKSLLGITREQQAYPERETEPMCNPAAQAELLEKAGCQLAVILGLCVGHDTLFIRHCSIPCTVLAVKDRVLAHNPVGALYMADSYMKDRLYTYFGGRIIEKLPEAPVAAKAGWLKKLFGFLKGEK